MPLRRPLANANGPPPRHPLRTAGSRLPTRPCDGRRSTGRLQQCGRSVARVEEGEEVGDAGDLEDAARRTGRADDHERAVLAPEERSGTQEQVYAAGVQEGHVGEIDDECSARLVYRRVEGLGQPWGGVDVYVSADE